MIRKINTEEFKKEAVVGNAVIDFSAIWCGPCKMMEPVMEELSEEMTDVNFFNVDVDENPVLAMEYGISSIPAILVLSDGEKKDMLIGFRPKAEIKADIEKCF